MIQITCIMIMYHECERQMKMNKYAYTKQFCRVQILNV